MSNLKAETTEPDPAATSLSNDDTVNKEGGDPSAPTDKEVVMGAAESEDVNGASKVKEKTAEETEAATDINEEIKDTKAEDSEVSLKKEDKISDSGVLKTKGQVDETRKNHSKYDPSILPTTDDPKKIRAQVEFYFSDANLPSDKHLWNLTDGELNLPVSISEICKFGRMKRFQPISAIVAALRESEFLEVTGPEGHEQVKRKVAYDPAAAKSTSESRSVYVKGFGDEEPSSQFDIEAFFAQFGPTNAVRLRRSAEKLFKGSVFVEFADEETAQKLLTLEPKPLWKGKHPLKFQPKNEYMAGKIQDIRDGKMEPAETWSQGNRGRGRGGRGNSYRGDRGNHRNDRDGRGRGDARGDRDPDDWKKRREEDRASGFKDDRHRNDRGRHGRDGDRKGGRGRGRGGRDGGRDDRGPRPDDRNRERKEKDRTGKDEPSEKTENEKKRVREDDDGADEKPLKKVDSKSEESPAVEASDSPATNGKKRAREDDEAGEPSTKKVDSKSEVAVEAS